MFEKKKEEVEQKGNNEEKLKNLVKDGHKILAEKNEVISNLQKEKEKKKPVGINKRLDDISEQMDWITQKRKAEKNYKKKSFKIPFKVKSQLKKAVLKNKAQIILMQETGNLKPTVGQVKEGMLMVGEKGDESFYDGDPSGVWLWNGKIPTYLVPEWDLRPLSKTGVNEMREYNKQGNTTIKKEELFNDALKDKRISYPQKIIIRSMEFKESLMGKKPMAKGTLLWVIIIGVIVAYLIFGGGA